MAEEDSLQVTIEDDGPWRIAHASGEVNLTTASDFRDRLFRALEAKRPLKVRLAEVSFIDSSGMAALVRAYKRAQELGLSMVLTEPSEAVSSVLELTKLTSLFSIETGQET